MSYKINSDLNRFKQIIKGKIRNDLKKLIGSDDIIGQQNNNIIKVPIQRIDLPRFTYKSQDSGGTGMGDGEPGDPIDGDPQKGKGKGKAGEDSEDHAYTAEFTPDELAQMLGDELQLPNIEPKGKGKINSVTHKYNGIQNVGSEGLRHFKRTYKQALKRSISSGEYDPDNPSIIPIKDDKRYKAPSYIEEPDCNTVCIYMMDVSGSMGDKEKHLVKSTVFWINLWLTSQYKNIENRFIVHDTEAKEVNKDEFFTISEAGGTKISSSLELCIKMIKEEHPFNDWNVYPFYFGDSDNLYNDNDKCLQLIEKDILLNSNMFSYGHINTSYGDGFYEDLNKSLGSKDNLALGEIKDSEDIIPAIKKFLGKGK